MSTANKATSLPEQPISVKVLSEEEAFPIRKSLRQYFRISRRAQSRFNVFWDFLLLGFVLLGLTCINHYSMRYNAVVNLPYPAWTSQAIYAGLTIISLVLAARFLKMSGVLYLQADEVKETLPVCDNALIGYAGPLGHIITLIHLDDNGVESRTIIPDCLVRDWQRRFWAGAWK